jgi:NADH-quinone oxidoreductase subunit H
MPNFWSDPFGFIFQGFNNILLGWGWSPATIQVVGDVLGALVLVMGSLLFCLLLIWAERKIGGRVQDRLGPNRVGPFGLVQAVADMLKIFTKEFVTPTGVDGPVYNLAPILSVAAVIMLWAVIPFTITFYGNDLNVGVLYIVAIGGLSAMGIVMAGWGSNNKFALIGAFRAVAQLVSYEVPMVVSLLLPVMLSGSMKLNEIVRSQDVWFILSAPIAAIIFFISSIAENGRAPFDLMEAESEIVAGFNIEYSGLKFGFFFVGDFLHAFTIALLFSVLFLGGWRGPGSDQIPLLGFVYLMLKATVMYFVGLLLRFSLPRFRIDQMMNINWKMLTPLALGAVIATALVDKASANLLVSLDPTVHAIARTIILLLANGLVLWTGLDLMGSVLERRERHVVALAPRPVARPEPAESGPIEPEPTEGEVS